MKKIIFTYGIIGGLILVVIMFSLMHVWEESGDFKTGEIVGYASIVLACSMVFIGVYKYRKSTKGSPLTFGRAFSIGLLITVVASILYVMGWLIYSNFVNPGFMDAYFEYSIEQLKASDLSQQEIEQKILQMEQMKEMYQNLLIQIGVTFLEVFPIGLLFSLIAGFIFRKKPSRD